MTKLMNSSIKRSPICLGISVIVYVGCVILILSVWLAPPSAGGNEGAPSGTFGEGLIALAGLIALVILYFIGFLLSLGSIMRGERFRWGAVVCAILYFALFAIMPFLHTR
jgi:hypothetical protein